MSTKTYALKVNRGYSANGETKNRWVQIGTMTKNKGEGHTVHLDLLPLVDPTTGRPEKFQVYKIEPKQQPATITEAANEAI